MSNKFIPSGLRGTDMTVGEASRLAIDGSQDPEIITLARRILLGAGVPERDHYGEVVMIHEWVKRNSRYTNDSVDAEVLTSIKGPMGLMQMYNDYGSFAGDCDDFVIFEAALLRAVGIDTRFVTLSRANRDAMNRMQHIYLEALVDNEWIPLDPILKKRRAGYSAPVFTAKKTYQPLGEYTMHPNIRIPKMLGRRSSVGASRAAAMSALRRRSHIVRPVARRAPSVLSDTPEHQETFSLGSIWDKIFGAVVRSTGTEAQKATLRDSNRIAKANEIFKKATTGGAVPLTGPDSIQYAVGVYKANVMPIPAGIPGADTPAVSNIIQNTPALPEGMSTTTMALIGIGGLAAMLFFMRRR